MNQTFVNCIIPTKGFGNSEKNCAMPSASESWHEVRMCGGWLWGEDGVECVVALLTEPPHDGRVDHNVNGERAPIPSR